MTPEVARIFALLPRSGKPGWRRGRLPLPLAARTAAEGLIGPFPLHLDALLPVSCLDRIPLGLAHGILDRDAVDPVGAGLLGHEREAELLAHHACIKVAQKPRRTATFHRYELISLYGIWRRKRLFIQRLFLIGRAADRHVRGILVSANGRCGADPP